MRKKYDPAAEAARRRTISLPPEGYEDQGPVRPAAPTDHLPPVGEERASSGYRYKQVKIPSGKGRHREAILNHYGEQGWRVQEIKRFVFGRDLAIPVRED